MHRCQCARRASTTASGPAQALLLPLQIGRIRNIVRGSNFSSASTHCVAPRRGPSRCEARTPLSGRRDPCVCIHARLHLWVCSCTCCAVCCLLAPSPLPLAQSQCRAWSLHIRLRWRGQSRGLRIAPRVVRAPACACACCVCALPAACCALMLLPRQRPLRHHNRTTRRNADVRVHVRRVCAVSGERL
jgi:hypothetical protein